MSKINNEERLKELEYKSGSKLCINVGVNHYNKLINNYDEYFYITWSNSIKFSPKQALEIVRSLNCDKYKEIKLTDGLFIKHTYDKDFKCEFVNIYNGYKYKLHDKEIKNMYDWLKEILKIGGYIKMNKKSVIKYRVNDNTIFATDGRNTGKATCNTSIDTFDEKKGKLIATARALDFDNDTVNKIIDVLFENCNELEDRISSAIDLLMPIINRNNKLID